MEKIFYLGICDNFKLEAEALQKADGINKFDIISFPSKCGNPQLSLEEVESLFTNCEPTSSIHLFGSCCIAHLSKDLDKFKGCTFHHFSQCFHMFCNNRYIDSLLQKGAYLVSPGWVANWQAHIEEWGFNRQYAQEFFEQAVDRLIFLDTEVSSDSHSQARNFAEFVKQPLDIFPIGLDYFELLVHKVSAQEEIQAKQSECSILNKRTSDYMMTLEILAGFSSFTKQDEIINAVIELFSMLFAPKKIQFFTLSQDKPEESSVLKDLNPDVEKFWKKLDDDGYAWIEPENSGFWILLRYEHMILGLIKVDDVAFPEYRRYYVNLALPIAQMCGLLVHNTNITQELKHANKMEALGVVAGGIAHDFNNFLSAIIGFSDMAKNAIPESNPARRMITKVLDTGNLAKELIEKFLAISDHDTNTAEPVSLISLVDKVLGLLESTPFTKTISFQRDIEMEAGTILADSTQVQQAIMNLCLNAMYAMKNNGGTLGIALRRIKGTDKKLRNLLSPVQHQPKYYAELIVKDTGSGIDEAMLDKIFDPYFTTKKFSSEKGIGMGLAVVNGIVKKHHGFINVDSKTGAGSSFYVYFPLIENNEPE